jgi:hypothetical protein
MNANEYDAWMRSKPKARNDDHVRQPIMPGMKAFKRPERDRFEGFRPSREHSIEPERT